MFSFYFKCEIYIYVLEKQSIVKIYVRLAFTMETGRLNYDKRSDTNNTGLLNWLH